MSLQAAVGTDTYGGLTGFKRPTSGNPSRIPSNLPAFRGTPNTPGSNIKAPAIKSSANHPDRKTNVCIPYARQTPLKVDANIGRVQAGDLIFVSRDRPGIPGYAHSRFSRLCGVDALNRFQGPDFWDMKTEDGAHRYILLNSDRVADEWRRVPFLGEWSLDGVVLSNEEKEVYYNDSVGKHDGQLYNIAIQGPCILNNGFIDRNGQGQTNRALQVFAPGYMDHRTEHIGKDVLDVEQSWDFQADYRGPQYHLYPMQMFDRNIRPMNELFCGLVAVKYTKASFNVLKQAATLEASIKSLRAAGGDASAKEKNYLKLKPKLKKAVKAKTAYQKLGWWNEAAGTPNSQAPESFHTFLWVLFTSSHAWELDADIDIAAPAGELDTRTKRQKVEVDPWDDMETRKEHMRGMVGAWRIGNVLDMKAARMPGFSGGPEDTGFRVTCDVNIEWWDWRRLRRKFTTNPGASQFGENHEDRFDIGDPALVAEHERLLRWPSRFDPKGSDNNYPLSMDKYSTLKESDVKDFNYNEHVVAQKASYVGANPDVAVAQTRAEEAFGPDSDIPVAIEALAGRDNLLKQLPVMPPDGGDVQFHTARADAALHNLQILLAPPTAEEYQLHRQLQHPSHRRTHGASDPKKTLSATAATAASAGIASYVTARGAEVDADADAETMAEAPADPEALHTAASAEAPPISVASLVAPTAPPPATATNTDTAAAASTLPAPLRRRAGNTPEPSPDRAGVVAAATATTTTAGTSEALGSTEEEPVVASGPATKAAPRKARSGAPPSDVFSSIFGATDTSAPMQPLNPAHRTDAASSGASGSTGRSFARRGKGKDKEGQ